ncbi:MAG: hypothetical protein M3Z09_10525 [Acidobacteriota bacterium]|nr:hypothetical protein [Acidobacteriota bacterium]
MRKTSVGELGVLAVPRFRFLSPVAPFAYAALAASTILKHEPWADEAQAWLLARDSSLPALWSHLLHYEGTPGLWHTLLFALTRLHMPYAGLSFFSGLLGLAAACLVFRCSPFPFAIRLALPFTYFLAYQYCVVARSYSLLPVLLFAAAALYRSRGGHPWVYTALLCLLAAVSVHGLVLSAGLAATSWRRRWLLVYAAAAALCAWAAWPAQDVTFVRHFNFTGEHFRLTAARMLASAFTGEWMSSLAVLLATLPFLARGGGLPFFGFSAAGLMILTAVVYGQVWHYGILLLAWIFALWISAERTNMGWLAGTAVGAVLAIQCYWTAGSIRYDLRFPYSGSRAAAGFMAARSVPLAGVYGVGYAVVAVQPYFPRNVFSNFETAYWDWSSRNHMIADYENLEHRRPAWVLVGYKTAEENYLWNSQVRRSGYRVVKHFEGNLVWEGEVFEPESFDLYRRQ